jgi:putative nucleotidyltransferase with HDIG domain
MTKKGVNCLDRVQAISLIREHVSNENLLKHMFATEAVMRAVARDQGQDEELWGLAGLLHDLDAEQTTVESHGVKGAEILTEEGLSPEIIHAVRAHNGENNGETAQTFLARALLPVDQVTGLITAAALIRPDKLLTLTTDSVLKRFKEKRFAAGVIREQISRCQDINYDLPYFITLALDAMKDVHEQLGL